MRGPAVVGARATDRMTWFMEVVWVIVALPLLVRRWRRFPLTRLLCWLLAVARAGADPRRRLHLCGDAARILAARWH